MFWNKNENVNSTGMENNPYTGNMNGTGMEYNPYMGNMNSTGMDNGSREYNPYLDDRIDGNAEYNPYLDDRIYNSEYHGTIMPEKSNALKIAIIVTLSVIVVAGLAFGSWLLFFKEKHGKKEKGMSPEELAEAFLVAFENYDAETVISLFPDDLAEVDEVNQFTEMFSMYASMNMYIRFKNVVYVEGEDYTESELEELKEDLIDEGYKSAIDIDNARNVQIKGVLEFGYDDYDSDTDFDETITISKINGEWKLIKVFH